MLVGVKNANWQQLSASADEHMQSAASSISGSRDNEIQAVMSCSFLLQKIVAKLQSCKGTFLSRVPVTHIRKRAAVLQTFYVTFGFGFGVFKRADHADNLGVWYLLANE